MPNLFVIGAAKCGTTSLHHYLDLHPEISMSKIKEPGYFLDEGHETRRVDSREAYLELFDLGHAVRGESSVVYSGSDRAAAIAGRMAAEAPGASLVYLVRDPIERLLSGLRMTLGEGVVSQADLRFGNDLEDLIGDPHDPTNPRLVASRYMTQIRRFMAAFSESQILVIDSDRLRGDRIATIQEIYSFLDVDPTFNHRLFKLERNTAAARKRGRLNRIVRTNEYLRRATTVLPEPTRQRLMRGAGRLTGREVRLPDPDPELLDTLREIYRPEVEELREFTDQEFAGWSI